MTSLSFAQLEGIWMEAAKGTKYATNAWAKLMAAIALAESSGNPNATNPTDNNGKQTSWGLWQISLGNHNQPSPTWNNPLENAKLAIQKLESQGLGAWGTYTSGAYKSHLPAGTVTPVTTPISGTNSTPAQAHSSSKTTTTTATQPSNATLTSYPFPGGIADPLNLPFAAGQAVAGSVGSGITGAIENWLWGQLHIPSPLDLLKRFGFIILGGILIIVGLIVLARPAAAATVRVAETAEGIRAAPATAASSAKRVRASVTK